MARRSQRKLDSSKVDREVLVGGTAVGAMHSGREARHGAVRSRKELLVPPTLAEQRAIAAVLDAGDREIAARRAERAVLARQQRGLMQRLLTGRLRVPA